MPRSFAITTSAPSVQLDGAGQREITFTVSNALGQPVRARAVLEPEGQLPHHWLALVGEPERELAPDGTQSFGVKIAVPPSTPAGSYAFHLVVVNVANPDEEFATGPSVAFQVQRSVASPVKKKFPLWIALLAAGVFLIALGAVTTGFILRNKQPGTGGAGSAPTMSLHFDGQTSYVDLGSPPSLDFSGNSTITVEAWIRPQATDGFRNIVAWGYTLNPAGEFILRISSGQYQVGSWNGAGHSAIAAVPPEDLGQWVHLAGVYDGSRWLLYRNGQVLASNPDSVGVLPVRAPWAIGARGGGTERFFQGDIAQVYLWKVPRTAEQINEDMRRGPKSDAQGLVGAWPLSEGRGAIVSDRSPSQAPGVIRGATWNTR